MNEIGRNFSSECHVAVSDDRSCHSSFSAALISFPVVTINGTEEVLVESVNNSEFLVPEWRNGKCHNAVSRLDLRFLLNGSVLTAAIARVSYSESSEFVLQKISIRFVERDSSLVDSVEEDDNVIVVQDGVKGPFHLSSMGSCDNGSNSTVIFLRQMITGCTVTVSSCEEAERKVQDLLTRSVPSHVLRNSTTTETNAVLLREKNQPMSDGCVLPIVIIFDVFYARLGPVSDFRHETVGLSVSYQFSTVSLPVDLPISFTVHFTDVTAPPKPHFSSLPYIDLRLPADAFYPFIKASGLNFSPAQLFFYLSLCHLKMFI